MRLIRCQTYLCCYMHQGSANSARGSTAASVRVGTNNRLRGRTSLRFCQERFVCSGTTEAAFRCRTCVSDQCASCFEQLHKLNKEKQEHQVVTVGAVNPDSLCQLSSCVSKNFADFHCSECALHYCAPCWAAAHRPLAKKHHSRIKFSTYQVSVCQCCDGDRCAQGW